MYSSGRRHSFDGSMFHRFDPDNPLGLSPPYVTEWTYGAHKLRLPPWLRDEELRRAWKNRKTGQKGTQQSEEPQKPKPEPVPQKPDVPEKDTPRRLLVEDVDLNIPENVKAGRTSLFECTQDRVDDDDKPQPAELVIRRGQYFKMTITFDKPYSKEKHDMKLCFTIGEKTSQSKGTKAEFDLDEKGPKEYKPSQWGGYLLSQSGNTIDVMVHCPANCIVGEWAFTVKTICDGKDKKGNPKKMIFQYTHPSDVSILFNPWCKEDDVYMESSELLDEYILNESGGVYRGNYRNFRGCPWNFAQFEAGVLDGCFFLLRKAFNTKKTVSPGMADPVKVSRMIVSIINSFDNEGVLQGNWSGDYEGGTSPLNWSSSSDIIKKYLKDGTVLYGQCWVFSCVTTAVFRCLGIPCRTVTNFASAHDENDTNCIEVSYILDVNGDKHDLPGMNESIWNFHVWNEVWFARPDLGKPKYDGWQAVDATPQEKSLGSSASEFEGIMTCGPSPVYAVKRGMTNIPYDTAFVFAEVNADKITFEVMPDGTVVRRKLETGTVGKYISTKRPDGQVFDEFDWNSRLDLTDQYKFPEGSDEERKAVGLAYKLAKKHDKEFIPYKVDEMEQSIEMKLEDIKDVMIGKDVEIEMKVKNQGTVPREISKGCITLAPKAYTGHSGGVFFTKRFESISLKPFEEKSVKTVVTVNDYFEHLIEQATVKVEAVCKVAPAQVDGPYTDIIKDDTFCFSRPVLKVKGPAKGKLDEEVEFNVSFTNPLPMKLTVCGMSMNSTGFRDVADIAVANVDENGNYSGVFKMKPKRLEKHKVIFTFQSKELEDIVGSTVIVVS